MIKKALLISTLVIALAGGSAFGVLRMVTLPLLYGESQSTQIESKPTADTNISDTDNIQDGNLNGQDDSQEVKGQEAGGEVEANEPANKQDQEKNLPDGGHQDQNNTNIDHQFEGVE